MSDDYHFFMEWRVAGTIEEVKAVLGDARALPRWWPAVYLSLAPIHLLRSPACGPVTG